MTHAFPSAAACANLLRALPALNALRRLSSRMSPTSARFLLPVALTLARHPEGLRMGGLADELRVDQSVASRQFARVEAAGLARRSADPHDGRVQVLHATEDGVAWVDEVIGAYAAALARHLPGWSDAELDELSRSLGRLSATFADDATIVDPIPIDLPPTPTTVRTSQEPPA